MTLFAGSIFDGTANVSNIASVGGSPHVATVESSPYFVAAGMTVPNVALVVSMTPKLQGPVVGTKFSAWAEHGFLYVDEESRVLLLIEATVKAER